MFRSLQLALAETLICHVLLERLDGGRDPNKRERCLVEAERMYIEMKGGYELARARGSGTWGSELEYLRVCIGRALVSHLSNCLTEARCRWKDVRKSAEVCKNVVTEFIPMITDCCASDVDLKLGIWPEADSVRKRTMQRLEEVEREHWWTGRGTFVIDWLKASM